jgi:hypothetical protein
VITVERRTQRVFRAAGTVLAMGLTLGLTAPAALARPASPEVSVVHRVVPGDNGTVKIHRSTTPVNSRVNQPVVCVFYLDDFGFDAFQKVNWNIRSWPPTGNRRIVASGKLTMNKNGNGHTRDMTLPNGHYKLFWSFNGMHGQPKHKVFWVKCASSHHHHGRHGRHGARSPRPVRRPFPVTG